MQLIIILKKRVLKVTRIEPSFYEEHAMQIQTSKQLNEYSSAVESVFSGLVTNPSEYYSFHDCSFT